MSDIKLEEALNKLEEIVDKLEAGDISLDDSLKVFEVLGCRDFARIDFRVSKDGIPYFIEINPLPGLGTYSDLVIIAQKLGWTHQGLITNVFNATLSRYPQYVCI